MAIIRSMTLADWASLSTIGQSVLVLISIFVIWYQLRQGIRLTKAANAQSLAEQAGSFNALLIQTSEVARIWYSYGKGLEKEEFKGLAAKERYRELLVQWLILHENIYYQHQGGLLDPVIYKSWAADLESTVAKHDLGVIVAPLEEVFCGDFGRHLVSLRKTGMVEGESHERESQVQSVG